MTRLTQGHLQRNQEPGFHYFIRWGQLLAPFVVYGAAGFEWAVLVAIAFATMQLSLLLRAIQFDTSCINMIKQFEHKLPMPEPVTEYEGRETEENDEDGDREISVLEPSSETEASHGNGAQLDGQLKRLLCELQPSESDDLRHVLAGAARLVSELPSTFKTLELTVDGHRALSVSPYPAPPSFGARPTARILLPETRVRWLFSVATRKGIGSLHEGPNGGWVLQRAELERLSALLKL